MTWLDNSILKKIKENPNDFLIIHYSCESLNDDNRELSAKIASIVVMFYSNKQCVDFSTHSTAELNGFNRENCEEKSDHIEKYLLEDFVKFVNNHLSKKWLHWNMKNIIYGFEHIAHRYKKHTGKDFPLISYDNRININDVLKSKYGDDYVPDPKMKNLIELNGKTPRNFVPGVDEPSLFKNKQYNKLHSSTLSKVEFFHDVITKAIKGKLKVKSKNVVYLIEKFLESPKAKFLSLLIAISGMIGTLTGWFGKLKNFYYSF